MASFVASLHSSALCADVTDPKQKSPDELSNTYDDTLRRIVDEHVPVYAASVRDHGLTPWFDDDCRKSRRQPRMFERRYRRSLPADNRLAWYSVPTPHCAGRELKPNEQHTVKRC
jgi:hypothetical protein